MSSSHKRAVANTIFWGIAMIGFLACAFAADGPGGLVHQAPRRLFAAAFLAIGILASLVFRYLTRVREDDPTTLVDERDDTIARRAAVGAFAVTALFVFLICIGLDDHFQEVGSVPVGWVWFVAYTSWILAYFVQAVVSLVLYVGVDSRSGFVRAEG